ncbi:hypothetical protein CLAFUW4_13362 [Fulvia fulva]|uniref:Uncharacterized protein n=1 Tax=Passalora fulva TaxID=5499 RepID=A0A9Q8UVK1_PASFU|nr:uncharacterized protein CLAFUR5_13217 [Fulvia fulva]KAK4612112.1 hypothetical protein CLAFUR4_13366 [Fulvia fulva]KAK4613012.1 hypothetical protein CLAFUR0_13372 [Fulvia fulva]UJO23995.1 hypothetical protein CLAFUR5_13217 [Fulvia fulva]WPV21354.1 hypothetical protein CLAFUW4_13362 [Fulvia fulva]WPV36359.1 hypothetical protein CLAFUW7_13369 [Fulvia fulva]
MNITTKIQPTPSHSSAESIAAGQRELASDKHRTANKPFLHSHHPYLKPEPEAQSRRLALLEEINRTLHVDPVLPVELFDKTFPRNPRDLNSPILPQLLALVDLDLGPPDPNYDFSKTKLGRQEKAVLAAREANKVPVRNHPEVPSEAIRKKHRKKKRARPGKGVGDQISGEAGDAEDNVAGAGNIA